MSAAEHPDWPAFLAAIVADPDDDTARLVAADFLEENGDADRAAFIRIQVELARLEATGQGKSLEADHLRAKERAFLGPLSMYRQLWAAEACPELVRVVSRGGGRDPLEAMRVEGADRLTWHRGFVEMVQCPAEVWLRHGETVRKRQPIRHVCATRCDRVNRDAWYGGLAGLRGLRSLGLVGCDSHLVSWLQNLLPGTHVVEVPV
jgi:uncharacterized protein (TIGR02996 family)